MANVDVLKFLFQANLSVIYLNVVIAYKYL